MNYLGIDYHKNYSFATMITEEGVIQKKEKLLNRKEAFREYLQGYTDVVAVVEASWAWPVAVELMEGLVEKVILAHPYKVRVIAESRIKTDSIDSGALAYLLRADLIPRAYKRNREELKRQKVLRSKSFLIKMRTQVKNRIHALMRTQREEVRETAKGFSDLFGKRGMEWLQGLGLEELMDVYKNLCGEIAKRDGVVKRMVREDPWYRGLFCGRDKIRDWGHREVFECIEVVQLCGVGAVHACEWGEGMARETDETGEQVAEVGGGEACDLLERGVEELLRKDTVQEGAEGGEGCDGAAACFYCVQGIAGQGYI
jgi:hypothetical protein